MRRVVKGPCVDGSELARGIFTSQSWSVQPCVRPLSAVHMTAGHNGLRGSGPGHKPAFENALALVGCPDRRIDRLCITCCSPSQPLHHAMVLGAISSDPQRGWIIVSLAPGHHCPSHSGELVGKGDGSDFGRPSCQQCCDPGPILGAMELGIADDGERNLAGAHGHIGFAKIALGHPEDTDAHIQQALRLSAWTLFAGMAKLYLGRDEEAVAWLRRHRFQPGLCHRAILSCGRFGAVRQVGRGQNRCEGGVGARSDLHHPPFPRQRIERESGLPRRTRTPDRGHAQGWCAGRMRTSAIPPERGDATYTTKMCRSAQGLGRVKTLCQKRSEVGTVAMRANFFDFGYARIAAIRG